MTDRKRNVITEGAVIDKPLVDDKPSSRRLLAIFDYPYPSPVEHTPCQCGISLHTWVSHRQRTMHIGQRQCLSAHPCRLSARLEKLMDRRQALKTGLVLVASATVASVFRPAGAKTYTGGTVWTTSLRHLPQPVIGDVRVFFTDDEARLLSLIHDSLIPADELGIGAVEAGCVRFVDHQLAGDFGNARSTYRRGPFKQGTPEQGSQSPLTPADVYRRGLAEFDAQAQRHAGAPFERLTLEAREAFLEKMEAGALQFDQVDAKAFFALLLQNVKEGYLADPLYGGNRDMVGWKLIGFPGARYDYRDYLGQIGKTIRIEPISLLEGV